MKKIEIKKEKNTDNLETKKIDELYEKKLAARKDGIALKPLRKEDVLKKTPIYAGSESNEEDEEAPQKKSKKIVAAKAPKKVVKKKVKPVMNDMLPQKQAVEVDEEESDEDEIGADDGETITEMTKDELLGRTPVAKKEEETFGGMSKDELLGRKPVEKKDEETFGGMTKDELLGRKPNEEKAVEEKAEENGAENGEEDDQAAIAAMREEIKRKMQEKNEAEKTDLFANRTGVEEVPEKKSFFSRLFSKKEVKLEMADNIVKESIEKAKADELAGLSEEEKKAVEKKANKSNLIVAFLVFVIMVTIGANAFYFYVQYKAPGMVPNVALSSAEQAKKDADETKRLVGEVIELPDDEEPILATVTDVQKVKNQKFFAKAQNGDGVLIYTINKKAILFRPITNKIIEVSQVSGLDYGTNNNTAAKTPDEPVSAGENKDGEAAADADSEKEVADKPIKVAVFNGSKTKGLAQKIGEMVVLVPGVAIGEKTNAKNEYEKTIVIDLSGEQADVTQRIAEALNGEIADFPEGEQKPDADVLVIAGSDFKLTE